MIDYGDVKKLIFLWKICEESVQCKASLGITGAIQGTSRNVIYQELGLESPKSRRWYKYLILSLT